MTKRKPTKPKRAPDPNARTHSVVVKVSARERAMVENKADRYTDGNVSELIRYALFNFDEFHKARK